MSRSAALPSAAPTAGSRRSPSHRSALLRYGLHGVCAGLALAACVAAAQTRTASPAQGSEQVPAQTGLAAAPEIQRAPYLPQAVAQAHTVRIVPEACAYWQGAFTGDAGAPYRLRALVTSKRCQPRARLVDAAQAAPSTANGWVLNDVIRIPSAECRGRSAVVRVWRKPSDAPKPALDGQGKPRIYLQDAQRDAAAGRLRALPQYTAVLALEGEACKP